MENITYAIAVSMHLGMEADYNELHPHVRYQEDSFIAGAYINSLSEPSFYVGRRWEKGSFGLDAALVTGYDNPLMPYLRFTYDNFFASPATEKDKLGTVIGYEFKW